MTTRRRFFARLAAAVAALVTGVRGMKARVPVSVDPFLSDDTAYWLKKD